MKNRRIFLAALLLLCILLPAAAQKTPVDNLYHYTLDNGLELYVMENSAAPLAYIEIAFKAGGIAQTPETAGMFHFYEHMMFKGNSRYRTAADVTSAYLDLGVTSWNGTTGTELVNYFFTVPSSKLKEGLEFWSYAIREPLLNPAELESEKDVVISEISGGFSEPGSIAWGFINRHMFPEYPWRRDPGGTVENIRKITVDDMRSIQQEYYIPNNAAIFVGGGVRHEDVYKLVKKIYGSWKPGKDPWETPLPPQTDQPFEKTEYFVYPNPQMSEAFAQTSIYFRGPDTDRDIKSTYAADAWGNLTASPSGRYKQALVSNPLLGIPDPDYTSASYYTQRDGGEVIFQTVMLSPEIQLPQRVKLLTDVITGQEIPAMISDPGYFTEQEYDINRRRLEDQEIISMETAEGFLSTLSFMWSSASGDYYYTYLDNIKAAGPGEIAGFLSTYINNAAGMVVVHVNPDVYEAQKEAFAAAGFTEITADDAYWWSAGKGAAK